MPESSRRPSSRTPRATARDRAGAPGPPASTGPLGTHRAGRRDADRRRPATDTRLQRLRTPLLALVVIAAVVGVSAFVFLSSSAPVYACSSVDRPQPAASGDLGQVQSDMGNAHVQTGDKVTYAVCPPASGKHVNRTGFGPLQPKVYGPEDQSMPNGWIHNLEHGGLVLLYSCDKGACDDATLGQLRTFSSGFPTSTVCKIPPGGVGPVVARFEQMPTRFAALVWDRVLYLDTLDTPRVYDFFTRYAERVDDGRWLAPPEQQCPAPSPSASSSASASPSSSASASPSSSASPSTSASTSASPSTSPSPSAS